MKIEAVVVLYNPNKNIIDNIKTYINEVETLYVIDNSSEKDNSLINEIKQLSQKCLYIDNFSNKGIAYALNMGVKLAIKESSDWLLTMDQDSKFEKNDLFKLIESIDEDDIQNIGIISPLHNINELNMNSDNNHITMTSGNLLNLHILEKIGFFLEDLSGYSSTIPEIQPGEVYVSPSLISMYDLKLGDEITFPIERNHRITLQVAGFYEDPMMGSSMIGMKGFLMVILIMAQSLLRVMRRSMLIQP